MYVLQFPDVEVYDILFEGLLATTLKGPEVRTLNKIISKLETVGTPKIVNGKPHSVLFTLAENTPVEIEDAHYHLMKKILNDVDWNTKNVKLLDRMLEFVENAPTREQFNARKDGILKLEEKREGSQPNS